MQGSFDLPEYMGSRATFTLGQFGGHGGRQLRVGDVLRLAQAHCDPARAQALPLPQRPAYASHWNIRVLHGPHGAPDFFTGRGHRNLLRHRLGSALQLQPHPACG